MLNGSSVHKTSSSLILERDWDSRLRNFCRRTKLDRGIGALYTPRATLLLHGLAVYTKARRTAYCNKNLRLFLCAPSKPIDWLHGLWSLNLALIGFISTSSRRYCNHSILFVCWLVGSFVSCYVRYDCISMKFGKDVHNNYVPDITTDFWEVKINSKRSKTDTQRTLFVIVPSYRMSTNITFIGGVWRLPCNSTLIACGLHVKLQGVCR